MPVISLPASPYNMAPGNIITRVNYIITKWEDPCAAPWWVYIETALPAALELIIGLVQFDLGDAIRDRFDNKGGRRGRKRFTNAQRFAATFRSKDGLKHFWRLDGLLQRALFWYLVVDLSTEFLYKWTTLIYGTEYCTGGQLGSLSRTGTWSAGNHSGDFGNPLPIGTLVENTAGWDTTSTITTVPPGKYAVSLNFNSTRNYQTAPFSIRPRVQIAQAIGPTRVLAPDYEHASTGPGTNCMIFGNVEITDSTATISTHYQGESGGIWSSDLDAIAFTIRRYE